MEKSITDSSYLHGTTTFTAASAAVIGFTSIFGWCARVDVLKSLGQPVAMNPLVAVSLIVLAAALWLRRAKPVHGASARAAHLMGATIVVIGGWRTAGYLFAGLPTIDRLLFTSQLAGNVIAPNTGICLLLLGLAIVTLDVWPRGGRSPAPIFAFIAGVIPLVALLGYALAILSMYRLGQYIAMALNTAVALLLLSVGILCSRHAEGFVGQIVRRWTVERTTSTAFSVSLLMLCLIGGVAYHSTTELIAANHIDHELQDESLKLSDLLSTVKDAETGQRGYLLTGDEQYLDPYKRSVERIGEKLEAVRRSTAARPAQQERLSALKPLLALKMLELERTVSLRRTEGFDSAMQVVKAGEGQRLMGQIRRISLAMQDEDRRLSALGDLGQEAVSSQTLRSVALGMLMTVALMLLATIVIRRSMRRQASAQNQLEESEQRFRQLAENVREVFWLTSIDGSQIVYVSAAYEPMWGRSVQSLYENPRGWLDAVHEEDRRHVSEAFDTTAARGEYNVQFRIVRPDGSMRWIHARGSVIRDVDGMPYRMGGIAEDVTDEQLNREQLQAARDTADVANRSKSEFLANMSHEIRTPMAAVLGYADMLLEPELSASDRLDHVYTIRRNAEHLLNVLNDILDLSKIEAGKLQVEFVDTDLRQVVHDVISLMRVRAVEKRLAIDVTYAGPIPQTIKTDPTRLRQILLNLVGNALKFTESGGVQLVVMLADGIPGRPRVDITVIDSGIGMTPSQVEQLFQRFEQGDTSTTRKYGGSGLGLTICRRLSQMLGGDISVQSSPGVGSRFVVSVEVGELTGVPMLFEPRESVQPREAQKDEKWLARLRGRILLAEDGVHNQRVISFYLQKAGAEVVVAENGRIACDRVAEAIAAGQPIDAVLMDMQMPELDGYTATSTLRSRGFAGPIIALTAHAMSQDREKCLKSGCTDYLTKPVDRAKLLSTLAAHMQDATRGKSFESRVLASSTRVEGVLASSAPVAATEGVLRSELDDDQDTRAFLPAFVSDLPRMVAQLGSLLDQKAIEDLRNAVHQIKGTGGVYGFPVLTDAAARVEVGIDAAQPEQLVEDVRKLIELMRSIEGYVIGDEHVAAPASTRKEPA